MKFNGRTDKGDVQGFVFCVSEQRAKAKAAARFGRMASFRERKTFILNPAVVTPIPTSATKRRPNAPPPRRKTRAWKPPVIYRRTASVRKMSITRRGENPERFNGLKLQFFGYEGVRRYVIGGFHARLSAGFRFGVFRKIFVLRTDAVRRYVIGGFHARLSAGFRFGVLFEIYVLRTDADRRYSPSTAGYKTKASVCENKSRDVLPIELLASSYKFPTDVSAASASIIALVAASTASSQRFSPKRSL